MSSPEFDAWWASDEEAKINRSPYWAYKGWCAAKQDSQKQVNALLDFAEEVRRSDDERLARMAIAVIAQTKCGGEK